uniref:Uncharacterized protein n=1 Tax=Castor canadensis TaxID=51338 RepID=A0A8C0WFQ2_CASCN
WGMARGGRKSSPRSPSALGHRAHPQTCRSSGSLRPAGTWEGTRREEVGREGADSPAAPREPQLRSRSAQLRAGPDAAPAGGGCAEPSSPCEEPFSPAPQPRQQPPSSAAPAASSAPSFRRFF